MFKWICLAIATLGLAAFLWMVNDIRLTVARTADRLDHELVPLIKSSDKAVNAIDARLPSILDKAEATVTTAVEFSEDFKQYKEAFVAQYNGDQAREMTKYINELLDSIQAQSQDATIGIKNLDQTLKTATNVAHWVQSVRRDAGFLGLLSNSREEAVKRVCSAKSGECLHIQVGKETPKPLEAWLQENHAKK
jgi:hypothetical protein